MLATTERVEILDEAEALAKMILQSKTVEFYLDCFYKLKNNKQAQKKIKEFVKIKEQYEEVQRFGKYHPDYKFVMNNIRQVKREMDLDEDVANFKKAETELQMLLDDISKIIGKSISEHVKVPTGNPYFDHVSSCGGGCGAGGSCGCS
ncbi:YlbF family regulator [Bacillus aquiflavi]|uniref:YlbF family regulator n=1 Tax=Bacillus aquiflavi TaxID=2672567 RepID=A0A6B3W2S4_9BACI|nr:YlbF family regulator [Bacillus aquiflavi]MBA4537950.1 YlbF family regulator [Bacillus aquiflavi]NEY82206.1 YlbF family regulator [Bacillus aquiflavi]UAC49278.1 YlbF family regulator [Bacillus aquiflavi]